MFRCRHEKCKYYEQHDFNESVAVCSISVNRCAFSKNADIYCKLPERIKKAKEFLIELEHEYMKHQLESIREIVDSTYGYIIETEDVAPNDLIKGKVNGMEEICDLIDEIVNEVN